MKLEILNDKNIVVMTTTSVCCIPDKSTLNVMSKGGYKFKLDGKSITIKKLKELENIENDQD